MLKYDEDKKVSLEFRDLLSRNSQIQPAYKWNFNKQKVNRQTINILGLPKKVVGPNLLKLTEFISKIDRFD